MPVKFETNVDLPVPMPPKIKIIGISGLNASACLISVISLSGACLISVISLSGA